MRRGLTFSSVATGAGSPARSSSMSDRSISPAGAAVADLGLRPRFAPVVVVVVPAALGGRPTFLAGAAVTAVALSATFFSSAVAGVDLVVLVTVFAFVAADAFGAAAPVLAAGTAATFNGLTAA